MVSLGEKTERKRGWEWEQKLDIVSIRFHT